MRVSDLFTISVIVVLHLELAHVEVSDDGMLIYFLQVALVYAVECFHLARFLVLEHDLADEILRSRRSYASQVLLSYYSEKVKLVRAVRICKF